MIELNSEHLFVRCIWLYLLVTSHTHCRVNPHYVLHICVNVKELFARNTCNIWSLKDWSGTRNYNHLVPKWTVRHLAEPTKWLRWVVSIYVYGAFAFMFLSCHVRMSEWMHTLYLIECQGTPFSEQPQYLKFKWLQRDSNPEPLSSQTISQAFDQTDEMIELSREQLFVLCIWLYALVISRTYFRVNSHSIFPSMSRNSFLQTGEIS